MLAVFCTHADVPHIRGGGLGVDVFFVLSGFLITTLLVGERTDTGRVGLRAFYIRRGLRLLPALFAVCAFTLLLPIGVDPASLATLSSGGPDGSLWANTAGEIAVALLYVADFAHLFGVEDVFLGHTWSLAVEEQFYAVWPVCFTVAVCKLRGGAQVALVGAATLALAGLRVADVAGPGGLFQLRFDQILLGVTVALALAWRPRLAVIGRAWPVAAAVVVGVVILGTSSDVVVSVVGAAAGVVIVACWEGQLGKATALFEWAPIVFIGRISYGLYLWHLPIFRRIYLADLNLPGPAVVAMKFGLAFFAATVCWHVVERPALRLKKRRYERTGDPVPV